MSQEEHDKPSTSFSSARKSQRSSVSKENKLEKHIYNYIYVQTSVYSSIYKNSDIRTIILCFVLIDRPCH